ncbi:anti-sigma factor family protein [Rhizobium leguminosarum]|uniref:anti-sigma factor family protein n=1 Tax=Rhizobium leguminosarum TaxID=384 RepID=UPI00143F56F9|nr:anti-sigma factor [Rhizobium leguminosarum]NKL23404.1 anti-sigma factor [Rhizobium leguminosarum bv. viciae]
MNMKPITEDDLQAYVDNALDAERHLEVSAFLEKNDQAARRIGSYRRDAEALRSALAPVAAEAVPSRLNLAHMIEAKGPAPGRRFASMAAAAVLLLAIGGSGGWLLKGFSMPSSEGVAALAQEASASYTVFSPDTVRPVEVRADGNTDLKQIASGVVGSAVAIPDLSKVGYRLMGGRVIPTSHGPGFMVMYDDDKGNRLVMLTRRMQVDQDKPMVASTQQDVHGWSWAENGMGYSLVGSLAPDRLHPIADAVRSQI